MNHNPIETIPTLYICPLCAWRGVLTTAGLVTTEHGDASIDHRAAVLAQQQDMRDTAERIMNRLREQYANCVTVPTTGHSLTLRQLQRLYRAVAGEFTR
jgi:hypothetical protein